VPYTRVQAHALEPAHPAASRYDKGIGQALGIATFGIYQVELPPGLVFIAVCAS
jgi:uncharacterized cupin superfamily protein